MNYRPGRAEVRLRVDGSGDAWRLHACTYEDRRLVWVQDWETTFESRADAENEGRAYAVRMNRLAPPDATPDAILYLFDGEMPADIYYDHYSGNPVT